MNNISFYENVLRYAVKGEKRESERDVRVIEILHRYLNKIINYDVHCTVENFY